MKNKKILIIDSLENMDNADSKLSVHTRNALLLSKYLNCDVVGSKEYDFHVRKIINNRYDIIIFNYGSGYMEFKFIMDFCLKNKDTKYFLIQNEYNSKNPVLEKLAYRHNIKYKVISNYFSTNDTALFHYYYGKHFDEYTVLNLNAIIYEGKIEDDRVSGFFSAYKKENKIPIIYYGMFRTDRVKYFLKYFDEDFHVSVSPKRIRYYIDAGVTAKFIPPLKWAGNENRLFDVRSSLYIEDEFTHTNYNFLANRFYEGLMYNVPLFFDKSCMNTIEKSGYPIDDYFIVDNKKELMKKVNELNNYSYPQKMHDKARSERAEVLKKIKEYIGA